MLNVSKLGSREWKKRGFLLENAIDWISSMTCSLFISPTMKMRKKKQAEGNGKWQLKKKENSQEKTYFDNARNANLLGKKNRQAQTGTGFTTRNYQYSTKTSRDLGFQKIFIPFG